MTKTEWADVEARALSRLVEAGFPVRGSRLYLSTDPKRCSHLEITLVEPGHRFVAREAVAKVLGPKFAIRCHQHPQSTPLDAVYVFDAAHAWPDETFRRSTAGLGRSYDNTRSQRLLEEIRKKMNEEMEKEKYMTPEERAEKLARFKAKCEEDREAELKVRKEAARARNRARYAAKKKKEREGLRTRPVDFRSQSQG
jgi:hypothetical protein